MFKNPKILNYSAKRGKMSKEIKSKTKLINLIVVLALLIYSAYLVLAIVAVHGGIVVSIPGHGTNISSINNTFIINVTYNVTGITNPIVANGSFGDSTDGINTSSNNLTIFYINDSGTWRAINGTINSSAYIIETNRSISVVVNTTKLTNVNYSAAINVTIGNLTSAVYIDPANMSFNITIDDTPPAVTVSFIGINYTNRSDPGNSNYSDGLLHLNVTVTDATIGPDIILINLSNATGTQEGVFNATRTSTAGVYNVSAAINITKYIEGKYVLGVVANDTLNNKNATQNSTAIYFDSSIPVSWPANISVPAAGNYSQNMSLNITAVDYVNTALGSNGSGISSVRFLVINGTGGTNATYNGTREASTDRWSTIINTSHLPDNNYSVTVYVNDSAGNTNKSSVTPLFFIDNSGPSVSYSCTPSSVTEGESIACTCSGSDATSGFNTSTISYTSTPSTTSTGTFSLSCSGADNAGNGGSISISYSVTGIGSSSGGGGGGGAGTTAGEAKKAQSWTKITPGSATIMKNFNVEYGVKEINVQVKNEAKDVKITVTKYDSKPAEVTKEKSGKVYKYLKIDTENIEGNLDKATITIKVPQEWITENSLDKDNIALFKLVSGNWQELSTKYREADVISYYYDVDLTGFSYFAIGQKASSESEKEEKPSSSAAEAVEKATEEAKSWLSNNIWLGIIIIVAIAGIIAFIIYKKRQ